MQVVVEVLAGVVAVRADAADARGEVDDTISGASSRRGGGRAAISTRS